MLQAISAATTTDWRQPTLDRRDRKARLLASSLLTSGTLRSLAATAGMMSLLGVSPAFAQCFSGAGTPIGAAACQSTAHTGANSTAIGLGATATGANATAYGNGSIANGGFATATGENSLANGASATATGVTSFANGRFATATGQSSAADGFAATATGQNSVATGLAATATGQLSVATGDFATATGQNSAATGLAATATGQLSNATGDFATAMGANSAANGLNATATGQNSTANGATASAFGQGSTASGNATTAIGQASVASATGATAVGAGASATFANSAAFGNGATASAANQMSFGTASNTYKLSGVTSAASLAAQSGPVSLVTTDAAGNLATANFSPQNLTSLQSQVTSLQSQVLDNRLEARTGTAVALAVGATPALQAGRRFGISASYGNFQGSNAFGVGATALLYDNKSYAVVVNAGAGVGLERSMVGVRSAVSLQW